MRKEFDQDELARWYSGIYTCFWCKIAHGDCFHHIDASGDYSDSLLNAALLNNFNCHINIHSKLRKAENVKLLLERVMTFLLSKGYLLNDTDKHFIEDHKQLYEDILKNRHSTL